MKLNNFFSDDCWFFKNIKVLEKKLNKKRRENIKNH